MAPRKTNLKRRNKKARLPRRMPTAGVPEYASMTEFIKTVQSSDLATSFAIGYNDLVLADCPRAVGVAEWYQFYRIKRVKYVIKPTYDTWLPTGPTVPYVYWSINRTGETGLTLTLSDLEARGSKPMRLDDKNVEFSYSPAIGTQIVQSGVGSYANQPNDHRISPWLNTDSQDSITLGLWTPAIDRHFGHYMMISCSDNTLKFDVVIQVEFEFKKARATGTYVPPPGTVVPEDAFKQRRDKLLANKTAENVQAVAPA